MSAVRFTLEDLQRANEEWHCNCGPGAIAAIMGMTLDEVRPHMGDFEAKGYTNPTLMWSVLDSIGRRWTKLRQPLTWPIFGLCRIQWDGPWCDEGVSPRAAYRHTHWVAAQTTQLAGHRLDIGVFDINAMNSGGWVSLRDWGDHVVPWILKECVPRASGKWWLTHVVEVEREAARAAA